ncbi:MAG: hypothetical protein DRP66_01950 [Planctomycetota bacterium]|nr:MAG: hypothetical protein DRP66_01950 [Planctomycetota bacterium]
MKKFYSQPGFTLSEVLIVVAILLILAGALVGFGKHLKQQARASLCECTIGVLIAAIEQYHDWHDAFPDPANDPVMSPIENLYAQLYNQPRSCALCEQIEKSQKGDIDGDRAFEFLDPWGKPLDYRYLPGMTFPVVESGGPDGDLATAADNISSR